MSQGNHTDLLRQFGLSRNPFVDRTAEKTTLDPVSLYVHSDLHGFTPSGAAGPGALEGVPAPGCVCRRSLLPAPASRIPVAWCWSRG